MRLSFVSVLKCLFLVALIVGLGIAGYMLSARVPGLLKDLSGSTPVESMTPGREVIVTIPKGASLSQVGSVLQEKGIISSKLVFKIVAFIRGEQRGIKAGDYALRTGSDAGEVLDQLISGKTLVLSITVPEGYDMYQVADLIQQQGIMSRDDFLTVSQDPAFLKDLGVEGTSLEGYLFPDTYFFRPSEKVDGKSIIRKMVQRFTGVYDKYVRATAEENGWSPVQVLTLASLIEKEARASEHQLVSAVFHNRLRQNMKLQSDPTVIYGIKPMGSKITREDLNRKHPYNTYQNTGLPPGPIANPGKESLTAAVKPADVDYLYFVARNDGSHQFSSSLKEHNHWVNVYQRAPRSQIQ
ncbi:MAG TPA: endolytic transglycosylase MltG [Desulfomonilaceae bacterium]|nr:endolytic transglycosylase MltG [Desulfomonilaceae bacterium]